MVSDCRWIVKYILHYVGNMNRGGMENVIMNLYRAIDKTKIQFHFAVHSEEKSDYEDEIISMGGKIIRFPLYRENPLIYKKEWLEFWKKNKDFYSWFHYHTNSLANITAIKAAKKEGMKNIIIHAHSSYANKGKIQKIHDYIHRINQKYIMHSNIVCIAVSNDAAIWLFGKNNHKVKIINNGINYGAYLPSLNDRKIIREKYNIDNDSLVIGHVGNFLKVKNHKFLIEVFKEIKLIENQSILLLLGDGILKNEIQDLVKKEGLEDSVLFLGNVPEVSSYLNSMDVFIFPSIFEGLGMSVIEAQVNGLPVLLSSTLPNEVKISPSFVKLELKKGAKEWAKAAINLISPNRIEQKGYLNNKFDINNTMREIVELYNGGEEEK